MHLLEFWIFGKKVLTLPEILIVEEQFGEKMNKTWTKIYWHTKQRENFIFSTRKKTLIKNNNFSPILGNFNHIYQF